MDTNLDVGQLSDLPKLPIINWRLFAELTGFEEGVVQGWMGKGYIPTIPIGKHSCINLELLRKICLEREFKL
jgi:hypothetical protein